MMSTKGNHSVYATNHYGAWCNRSRKLSFRWHQRVATIIGAL
jgi:hypothetical protein